MLQHLTSHTRQVSVGSTHLLADVRLRPRPPALVEIMKMKVDGMLLKSSTFFCRWLCTGFGIPSELRWCTRHQAPSRPPTLPLLADLHAATHTAHKPACANPKR